MTRRDPQLDLPGTRVANDDVPVEVANDNRLPAGLDDVLGGARYVGRVDPVRAAARRLHEAQGRAARGAGNAGEHWIDLHHGRAVAEHHVLAKVWHVGEPGVPHVKGGRVQFDHRHRLLKAVTDHAPPDYLGILEDGRGLVVEMKRRAKRLSRDRVRANGAEDRDAIEAHQVRDLRVVGARPCLTLLVVEFERARETIHCAVPWAIADTRWASPRGGVPSLGPDELSDFRVTGDCYLLRFCEAPPR